MDVHEVATGVAMDQVLAPSLGPGEHLAVESGCCGGEPPLWAGDGDRVRGELALVQSRQSVKRMTFRHGPPLRSAGRQGRWGAGALVLGEDVDPSLMTFFAGPSRGDESIHDRQGLFSAVHTAADADQLSVVVLPGQLGGLHAPGECTPGTGNLVRSDLLAVATAAEDNAQTPLVCDGAAGGLHAERRVIVDGVVFVRPAVDHLVPTGRQVFRDLAFEFEPGMVAT